MKKLICAGCVVIITTMAHSAALTKEQQNQLGAKIEFLQEAAKCNALPTWLGVWDCRADAAEMRDIMLQNVENK